MRTRALRQGYRQMEMQVRCECGRAAVRQVWFWLLTPNLDRRVQASLALCEECYREMAAFDAVSDRPVEGGEVGCA